MTDTYVECLVKQNPKAFKKFLKYLMISLTVLMGIACLLTGMLILFAVAVGMGVLAYFVSLNSELEYEYLYCDREITIDKIMSQTKRKRVAKFEVDKMEILAPANSYKLDEFKNRQWKESDYSSGDLQNPRRYVFYYEGQKKVIIEPSEAFVKAVYNVAPRKVVQN